MGKQKTGQTKRLLKFLGQDKCCVDCPPISPDEGNIIECRGGKLFAEAAQEVTPFSLNTINSNTVVFSGDGTEDNPLTAESLTAPIQNGIISGGEVTWISGYTYSVSPAIYYINGVQYTSPYTEITLDPADVTNNRIDVFVLTTSGTAEKITGTASTNPEQPSINTSIQLLTSFALVVANTTSPVGLSQEYIYKENVGTPIEWTATGSTGIVVSSLSNPFAGVVDIEGTNVTAGATLTFVDNAASAIYATKNVLIFYIRSKATWNNNRILSFQFKNGVTNIGTAVQFGRTSYGFDSSITGIYQRVVIPLSAFNLTPSDLVDRLVVTAVGAGGSFGFYIDEIELQGANLLPQQVGTTDNVGVFYVSKNYSGIGQALITGYNLSDISSANSGYNTQLSSARMGDPNKAYPDPWAARNAAMQKISSGEISRALIIVNGGNNWTVGSPVSSQNGSASGSAATATVADVQLQNGISSIHSLLKDKIDYYFNPNSRLQIICKSYQIFVGQTFEISANSFKTGIYGHGDFETIYGTQEGLSTRFIFIDNPWAEVTFEANKCVMQRAWMYLFNYKKVNIRMKHWIGSFWDSIVYEQGMSLDGDGSPSTLIVDCELAQLGGTKYFPYPSAGSGGTRSFIYINNGGGGNTREENRYYNFGVINLETWASTGTFISPQGDANVNRINERFVLNVGYLKQEVTPLTTTASGPLMSFTGSGGTGLRQNNTFIVNIQSADVTASLVDPRNNFTANASNVNNTVIVNVGQINKRATYGSFMTDAIINIPCTNQAIVGEKPKYEFNIGNAEVTTGHVIKNSGLTGWTYNSRCKISGILKNTTTNPVVYLDQAGYSCLLDGATLITAGAASIDGDIPGRSIYTKNVLANVPYTANVTQEGIMDIDPDIANYL